MKIVLFEDSGFENLYPLTYLRPVFELRCGAFTLKERIERKFPDATLYVETREALKELATESYGESRANNPNALRPDDDILLVNAGAILTCPSESYPGQDRIALNADGELVWAFLKKETVAGMQAGSAAELAQKATEALPSCTTEDILVRYPWDLIEENAEQIARDFRDFFQPAVNRRPPKPVRRRRCRNTAAHLYRLPQRPGHPDQRRYCARPHKHPRPRLHRAGHAAIRGQNPRRLLHRACMPGGRRS